MPDRGSIGHGKSRTLGGIAIVVIGLTGGIACGKSTVAKMLARHGFGVVDADAIARDVTEPGQPAYREIVATFGDAILLPDGRIDRPALGRRVFADADARKRLESITHGAIAAASADAFARLGASGHALVIYEAALLVETGRHTTFPALIVVTSPPDVQLARLLARNPELSAADAEARIASQMPMAQKAAAATHLIVNDGDLGSLEHQVVRVAEDLQGRFEREPS